MSRCENLFPLLDTEIFYVTFGVELGMHGLRQSWLKNHYCDIQAGQKNTGGIDFKYPPIIYLSSNHQYTCGILNRHIWEKTTRSLDILALFFHGAYDR